MSEADDGVNTQSGDKMQVLENIAITIIRCILHMKDKNYKWIGTNRSMHSGKHLCPAKRHYQETALRVCCKPRPQSLYWSWFEDLIPQVGPKGPTQERNSAS